MADRPQEFEINYGHQLAKDLVFAGLGRHARGLYYHDSSLHTKTGTMSGTGVTGSAWVWNHTLGRWTIDFTVATQRVAMTAPFSLAAGFTFATWLQADTNGGSAVGRVFETSTTHNLITTTDKLQLNFGAAATSTASVVGAGMFHVCVPVSPNGSFSFYLNGAVDSSGDCGTADDSTNMNLGNRAAANRGFDGWLADSMFWGRLLNESEIAALADPSNVMLSGLVLPPRRRIWRAATAASGAMTGTCTVAVTASGTLTGSGALAGSVAVAVTPSGTLTGSGALAGSCAVAVACTGTLTGSGALAGSSAITVTPSGTLTGVGALAGTCAVTVTLSGTLDGLLPGAMTGTCSIAVTGSGTLLGAGALAGSCVVTVTPSGTLTGAGALAGTCAVVVTVSGSLVDGTTVDAKSPWAIMEANYFIPGAVESNAFLPGAEEANTLNA